MRSKLLSVVLLSAAGLALTLDAAKPKYRKTAGCPIDLGTAHATGKTKSTMDPQCIAVEYKHKGTDYTDPRHPQRFQHVFWLTICNHPTATENQSN
jgi:hypothetical protein